MNTDPELATALTDVRRAYRLLWAYQRRVLDTVTRIAAAFDDLSFVHWLPHDFDRPAGASTNPAEKWAGDLLPMLSASFLYLPSSADRTMANKGQWMLDVAVVSDSGYPEGDQLSEPDPAKFEPVEVSNSSIELYVFQSLSRRPIRWINDLWHGVEWPGHLQLQESADPAARMFGMSFDLAGLGTADRIQTAVSKFRAQVGSAMDLRI